MGVCDQAFVLGLMLGLGVLSPHLKYAFSSFYGVLQ